MHKIKKVLNHNSVITVETDELKEYLIMGKGVGFGMKPTQAISIQSNYRLFSLSESSDRGTVKEIVKHVDPFFLEIAEEVLDNAEKNFPSVDHNIVFPMADHLEYATKRIRNHEEISNPLLNDIKILFYAEYKSAEIVRDLLQEKLSLDISDDEIGYIALHIHSSTSNDKISQSIETAQAVRNCISKIEETTGHKISIESLSYNRMMNHIRYMVARIQKQEPLKLSMNDYVSHAYPESFETAGIIYKELGKSLNAEFSQPEIGYLAMHIERVKADIMGEE